MKTSLLFWTALGALTILPGFSQAQFQRPVIISDAEYQARMEQEARARMSAQQQENLRQTAAMREAQCLQETTQVLTQSFAAHCKARKTPANSAEGELLRALTDLQADVTHLFNDIHSRCGKAGRVDLAHVYRTFHLTEYASQDAQGLAAQAGYVRSLSSYFQDIDSHLDQLGRAGYRNPRLRRIQMESPYAGSRSMAQERHILLPPVPAAQPVPAPVAPPRSSHHSDRDRDEKIDIGDVLKNIFKNKLK